MTKVTKPAHCQDLNTRQHGLAGSIKKRIRNTNPDLTENMTAGRWDKIIAATANGATRAEAAKAARIKKQTIAAYLISNVTAFRQLRDAQLLYLRRSWSTEKIEDIMQELAMGLTLEKAAEKCAVSEDELAQLYRLILKDKALRKFYDEARELQAETFVDQIIDISDDSNDDRLENGRINHEVVNRSKLRVDTRKWVMGAMVRRRFGEHKHVEHEGSIQINHAAVLIGGRKRVERLHHKAEKAKDVTPEPAMIEDGEVVTA